MVVPDYQSLCCQHLTFSWCLDYANKLNKKVLIDADQLSQLMIDYNIGDLKLNLKKLKN
jgi:restriction endonuclease Mrr